MLFNTDTVVSDEFKLEFSEMSRAERVPVTANKNMDMVEIFLKSLDPLCFLFRENERENQLKHMLELLRINASTHVIDIENVSAGKDFII